MTKTCNMENAKTIRRQKALDRLLLSNRRDALLSKEIVTLEDRIRYPEKGLTKKHRMK